MNISYTFQCGVWFMASASPRTKAGGRLEGGPRSPCCAGTASSTEAAAAPPNAGWERLAGGRQGQSVECHPSNRQHWSSFPASHPLSIRFWLPRTMNKNPRFFWQWFSNPIVCCCCFAGLVRWEGSTVCEEPEPVVRGGCWGAVSDKWGGRGRPVQLSHQRSRGSRRALWRPSSGASWVTQQLQQLKELYFKIFLFQMSLRVTPMATLLSFEFQYPFLIWGEKDGVGR